MNCTSYDFDFALQYIHLKKQTWNTKQTNQKLIQAKRVCRNCTNVQAIAKPSLVEKDRHSLRHGGQVESLSGGRSKEGATKKTPWWIRQYCSAKQLTKWSGSTEPWPHQVQSLFIINDINYIIKIKHKPSANTLAKGETSPATDSKHDSVRHASRRGSASLVQVPFIILTYDSDGRKS